jgi:hypothetical protein
MIKLVWLVLKLYPIFTNEKNIGSLLIEILEVEALV